MQIHLLNKFELNKVKQVEFKCLMKLRGLTYIGDPQCASKEGRTKTQPVVN